MGQELDLIKYYTASEKVQNVIYTIEGTMEFMTEFEIKADESVKKALIPVLTKLLNWVESK